VTSPWRTTEEAAEYLRFVSREGAPDVKRVHAWVTRYVRPLETPTRKLTRKVGRSLRIHVDALEIGA
jgi:hypothetical protein